MVAKALAGVLHSSVPLVRLYVCVLGRGSAFRVPCYGPPIDP